jgi:hypothetical protein
MRKRIVVAATLVVGLLLVVGAGAKVREIQVWGFLPPHGRENVRAGREVLDDLRDLNPDLVIEEHGWTGQAGIPLASFRYPEGFVVEDDLEVPSDMERAPVLEKDEPFEGTSLEDEVVTYEGSTFWSRHAARDGRPWYCSIRVEPIGADRLAEVAVSCYPD